MDILADTTLLIDLWREQKKPGPAMRFAGQHASLTTGIPWIVAGEFISGSVLAGQAAQNLEKFLRQYIIVHPNMEIIEQYAVLFAFIRQRRIEIGPNDLWIAACAISMKMPLVTRNIADFESLPDIRLIDYSGPK
jgi:predicted nucleic acid-binding protein